MSVPTQLEMSVSAAVWRAVGGDVGGGVEHERWGAAADGRLSIRYRGGELAYRTFNKIRQVDQGAIADNKRLGPLLAMIRDQQRRCEPGHRSQRAPRRRDQRDARLFKVG